MTMSLPLGSPAVPLLVVSCLFKTYSVFSSHEHSQVKGKEFAIPSILSLSWNNSKIVVVKAPLQMRKLGLRWIQGAAVTGLCGQRWALNPALSRDPKPGCSLWLLNSLAWTLFLIYLMRICWIPVMYKVLCYRRGSSEKNTNYKCCIPGVVRIIKNWVLNN